MKKEYIFSSLIFIGFAILYCRPIFINIDYWGQMDWDQFTFWSAVPRDTILKYKQFPFWNPFVNGGNVLLAHPHSLFLSPMFIFTLIFGPIVGLKIQVFAYFIIGLFGMFLLSRHLKLSISGSYLSAVIFMCSSIYVLHAVEGHISWLVLALLPYVYFFYLRGLKNHINIYFSALFLGIMYFSGSIYVFFISFQFLLLISILKSLKQKNFIAVKRFIFLALGVFTFSAVKLLPMLEFIIANPRIKYHNPLTNYNVNFYQIFLDKNQLTYDLLTWGETNKMNLPYEWHEYGAYVGILPLLLFIIGAVWGWRKFSLFILSGLVFFTISFGGSFGIDLWSLMIKLPVYKSLSVPFRYTFIFVFVISIICGFTLSSIEELIKNFKWKHANYFARIIPALILIVITFDLYKVNSPIFHNAFTIAPVAVIRNSEFSQKYRYFNYYDINNYNNRADTSVSHSSIYPIYLSNYGILDAYEIIKLPLGDIRLQDDSDYTAEAYLSEEGEVSIKEFSPNKIKLDVFSNVNNTLIFNQNYHHEWRAYINETRHKVFKRKGLIAVTLPAGRHEVILKYWPISFLIGALLTAGFLISLFIGLSRKGFNK